jgi:hypothetical protein
MRPGPPVLNNAGGAVIDPSSAIPRYYLSELGVPRFIPQLQRPGRITSPVELNAERAPWNSRVRIAMLSATELERPQPPPS